MSLMYGPYEPEAIRILPSRSSDSRSSPLTPHSANSHQHAHAPTPRAISAGAPPYPQHIAVWPSAAPPLGHSQSQSTTHASRPPPLTHTNSAPYVSRRSERLGRTYSVQYDPSQVVRTGSRSSVPHAQLEAYRAEESHRAEAAYREERSRGQDRERERRQSEHRAQSVRRPSNGGYYDEYDDRAPARTRSMSRPRETSRPVDPIQHPSHRPRTQSTRSYTTQSARGAQQTHPSGTKLQVVVLDGENRKAHAGAARSPASTGHAPVAQYFPQGSTKKTSFLAKLFGKGGEEARPRW